MSYILRTEHCDYNLTGRWRLERNVETNEFTMLIQGDPRGFIGCTWLREGEFKIIEELEANFVNQNS